MDCDERIWKAAIYVRLSREDGDKAESESILNQKKLIRAYMSDRPNFVETGVYEDDGYSGVNMNRPAFQQMMDDIRDERINCIIMKDLSRLGRNYIETGKLLETLFPYMGVRCVAITDNYDSARHNPQTDSLVIPLKNLINEAVCGDTSQKVRKLFDVKRKKGEYIGSFPAFGYAKDPMDHNRLVVDADSAQTVRDIFQWKIEGMSPDAIAQRLNGSGKASPFDYKKSTGCNYKTPFAGNERSAWTAVSVTRILMNSLYIGTLTQGIYTTRSYKSQRRIKKPIEEWACVHNSHEGIVSPEDFELVAALMKRDTRAAAGGSAVNLFSGMLFCADCGQNLVRRCVPRNGIKYYYQICTTYKKDKTCGSHNISEAALYDAVLAAVQTHLQICLTIEETVARVGQMPIRKYDLRRFQQQIENKQAELDKIARHRLKLYDDLSDGLISKADFQEFKAAYEHQKESAEKALASMTKELENVASNGNSHWITHFKKYHEIRELTRAVFVDLVDRVIIYDHARIQIVFRYQNEFNNALWYIESLSDGKMPERAVV